VSFDTRKVLEREREVQIHVEGLRAKRKKSIEDDLLIVKMYSYKKRKLKNINQ